MIPDGVKMSGKTRQKVDVPDMKRIEFHGLPIDKAKPVNDQ